MYCLDTIPTGVTMPQLEKEAHLNHDTTYVDTTKCKSMVRQELSFKNCKTPQSQNYHEILWLCDLWKRTSGERHHVTHMHLMHPGARHTVVQCMSGHVHHKGTRGFGR